MAIILLVVTKRADFPRADWRALAEHQIEVIHASSQARAWEAIAQAQPDFVLLAAAATRLVTRPFIEKVRKLAPEAGLMGLADAEWPLAPLLDHLLPPSATDWDLLRAMPAVKRMRSNHILIVSPIKLDTQQRRLWIGQDEHHLTPKQCCLLGLLMRRPNEIITRRELMEQVWQTAYLGDTRTLDVHMHWLRKKIEVDPKAPNILVTVRGQGFSLRGPA